MTNFLPAGIINDYLIRGIKTRGGYIRPVEKGELDGNN
jgi:hypothetical protein